MLKIVLTPADISSSPSSSSSVRKCGHMVTARLSNWPVPFTCLADEPTPESLWLIFQFNQWCCQFSHYIAFLLLPKLISCKMAMERLCPLIRKRQGKYFPLYWQSTAFHLLRMICWTKLELQRNYLLDVELLISSIMSWRRLNNASINNNNNYNDKILMIVYEGNWFLSLMHE